jgi:hypothetical protein
LKNKNLGSSNSSSESALFWVPKNRTCNRRFSLKSDFGPPLNYRRFFLQTEKFRNRLFLPKNADVEGFSRIFVKNRLNILFEALILR